MRTGEGVGCNAERFERTRRGDLALIDDAVEAFFQKLGVEVDQETEGKSAGSQVGEQLCFVDVMDLADGLEFNHNLSGYD
jgi:hypothetical protein